jgi:uncharacterized protein (TIGR02391 family)
MKLSDLIPDVDVLYALEPDELGLRMLPTFAKWDERRMGSSLSLQSVLYDVRGQGHHPGEYPPQESTRVEEAIREAWAWLEGEALLIPDQKGPTADVRSLSRRARKLAAEPEARKVLAARRVPKDALHPVIREDVWALYHRGKFATAILEAMIAVEVAVRAAAGLTTKDVGVSLMRKAFDPKTGALADLGVDEAEREARSHLFAGAIGSYKNPHSHRNVALDDPDEAAEVIMLANHLLRIVDSRKAASP